MNVFRKVAVAAFVMAAGTTLAVADGIDTSATSIGQATPGVYGRIQVAGKPTLPLVWEQPMFVERPDTAGKVEPVYLHVPPEHAKNWKKYCKQYQACNAPVYFVKSAEYEPGYEPPKPEEKSKAKRKFRSGW